MVEFGGGNGRENYVITFSKDEKYLQTHGVFQYFLPYRVAWT